VFGQLFDFSYRRSAVQAIGFYVVYFLIGIAISAVVGMLAAGLSGASGFEEGFKVGSQVGNVVAVIFSLGLSIAILRAKGLFHNVLALVVLVFSGIGAAVLGLFLGLIFVAFLTTRPAAGEEQPEVVAAA